MTTLIPGHFVAIGYALALGLLIGLERGWTAREEAAGTRVAGFRTFGLLGLTGGIAGLLPDAMAVTIVLFAGAILLAGYMRTSRQANGVSATNTIAGLMTLALGMLATRGLSTEAMAIAAVTTLLLSMRHTLHGWLKGISEAEMRSAARFALIALVVLPLAPDEAMGPLGAWNPHKLWLVVVLVSGLSFVGYLAGRRAAPAHSVLITALCGSIVSSTAVTAAYARRLAVDKTQGRALGTAILLAGVVMLIRVLLLAGLLAPFALASLTIIVLPGLCVLSVLTLLGLRSTREMSGEVAVKLGNPLELGVALGFAALIALLALASQWALGAFGHLGFAAVIALTGFADVDAAVVALSSAAPGAIDHRIAGMVLAGPVLLNTLFKAGLTVAFGRNIAAIRTAISLAVCVAASGIALFAMI